MSESFALPASLLTSARRVPILDSNMTTIDQIMNPSPAPTADQIRAALDVVIILGQIIREAGPDGIPNGVLYAQIMPSGIPLDTYTRALGLLKRSGVVSERCNVLRFEVA